METNYRISSASAFLMIGTALLFDIMQIMFGIFSLLGLIPYIGVIFEMFGWALDSLVSVYAWLTFFIWFTMKRVGGFTKASRVGAQIIVMLIEFSPLGFLPTWTLYTTTTIVQSWAEDRKKKTGGTSLPPENFDPGFEFEENESYA